MYLAMALFANRVLGKFSVNLRSLALGEARRRQCARRIYDTVNSMRETR